jgi:hypothetical protein
MANLPDLCAIKTACGVFHGKQRAKRKIQQTIGQYSTVSLVCLLPFRHSATIAFTLRTQRLCEIICGHSVIGESKISCTGCLNAGVQRISFAQKKQRAVQKGSFAMQTHRQA